jgi:hypothetical protein
MDAPLMEGQGSRPDDPGEAQADGPWPLSSPDGRLFLLDVLPPGLPVYNLPTLVRLGTTLDAELLRAAFNAIVQRHEILRTSIRLIDGVPAQEILPHGEIELTVVDLRSQPEAGRRLEADRILADLARQPSDLGADVLQRAGLASRSRTGPLLSSSTTTSDTCRGGVLFAELDRLYRALGGHWARLPELPIQYAGLRAVAAPERQPPRRAARVLDGKARGRTGAPRAARGPATARRSELPRTGA